MKLLEMFNEIPREDIFEEVFNVLSKHRKKHTLSSLEENLYLLSEFMKEIHDGSFNDYFYNESGDNAKETLKILKDMKLNDMYEILRKAIKEIPGYPENQKERQAIIEEIEFDVEDTWLSLEDKFLKEYDRATIKIHNYLEKNIYKM